MLCEHCLSPIFNHKGRWLHVGTAMGFCNIEDETNMNGASPQKVVQ